MSTCELDTALAGSGRREGRCAAGPLFSVLPIGAELAVEDHTQGSAPAQQGTRRPEAGVPLTVIFARRQDAWHGRTTRPALASAVPRVRNGEAASAARRRGNGVWRRARAGALPRERQRAGDRPTNGETPRDLSRQRRGIWAVDPHPPVPYLARMWPGPDGPACRRRALEVSGESCYKSDNTRCQRFTVQGFRWSTDQSQALASAWPWQHSFTSFT
jgi:hypothetical protein